MPNHARSAVVLGARNVGGAVVDRLISDGWRVTAVARSDKTVAAAEQRGARAVAADASDPEELNSVLATAHEVQGGLDLVVNALTPGPPPKGAPFGGGPVAGADLATFDTWTVAVAEQTFVFLSQSGVALREAGGGTLVQITGGSSRRAMAGQGPWAAGAFATRALTHSAAQELSDEGIHVALLVIDGVIGPREAVPPHQAGHDKCTELAEIADSVAFLARNRSHRQTHELLLARSGDPRGL